MDKKNFGFDFSYLVLDKTNIVDHGKMLYVKDKPVLRDITGDTTFILPHKLVVKLINDIHGYDGIAFCKIKGGE